ncbi:hypothetical protein WMF27_24055 [Sorangium sp. So ce281]|uniref:hypothetical protein n=1 Tax=unclassified Sorangium TaxID=2621164 RepID=UPI003F5F44A2
MHQLIHLMGLSKRCDQQHARWSLSVSERQNASLTATRSAAMAMHRVSSNVSRGFASSAPSLAVAALGSSLVSSAASSSNSPTQDESESKAKLAIKCLPHMAAPACDIYASRGVPLMLLENTTDAECRRVRW